MSAPTTWDAVVIGGGPAGSGTATHLARAGRRVLLLEREQFPREHIGESLLPGVLPYLDMLGAREKVERAGFERKEGQTFVWGRDRTPWEIDFRELDVHPYAFFVDRGAFDDLLLGHARECGATVRHGVAVREVLFDRGRATGVAYGDASGTRHEEHARFVVDASGQSAVVARGAGLRVPVRGLKNVAQWAYWDGASRLPDHRRAHILTVSIADGWIWCIPLADRMSVGIVTSAAASREARARLGATEWYERTLRECPPVWTLLANARRRGDVAGAKDWSYRARRLSGPGVLLAGDAACFIDPILSTGVHLAMTAAYWAAACVHSSLAEPRHEPFFRRFYDESYGTTYEELLMQVKAFYRSEVRRDSVYWTSKEVLRVGSAVRPNLAFLFITAGLLRNAATSAPHDPAAQARTELGAANTAVPVAARETRTTAGRAVSPPLVLRVGSGGEAQLVTVRADGLRLSIVPHEPRGLRDRPPDSYFVVDLLDGERLPLALALIEEPRRTRGASASPRSGRAAVTVLPYPVRERPVELLAEVERRLRALVDDGAAAGDTFDLSRLRARVRLALRKPGALPAGVSAAPARAYRGGGVAEPPMTAVFEASARPAKVDRVYLVLEARLPPELTDVPVLRTRFLDLWVRPGTTRDGEPLDAVPEVKALLAATTDALWLALRAATTRAAAFAAADAALRAPQRTTAGYALIACGRLGDVAGSTS